MLRGQLFLNLDILSVFVVVFIKVDNSSRWLLRVSLFIPGLLEKGSTEYHKYNNESFEATEKVCKKGSRGRRLKQGRGGKGKSNHGWDKKNEKWLEDINYCLFADSSFHFIERRRRVVIKPPRVRAWGNQPEYSLQTNINIPYVWQNKSGKQF